VQIDETFTIVDDMGNIVRADPAEELELMEELDRARLEDEQRITAEEDGTEWEEIQAQPTEEPDDSTEEIVLDQHQEVGRAEGDVGETPPEKPFRSKRKDRLWGVMAQALGAVQSQLAMTEPEANYLILQPPPKPEEAQRRGQTTVQTAFPSSLLQRSISVAIDSEVLGGLEQAGSGSVRQYCRISQGAKELIRAR
jgi:hypothetical protein